MTIARLIALQIKGIGMAFIIYCLATQFAALALNLF
jgi:hypothetical protein